MVTKDVDMITLIASCDFVKYFQMDQIPIVESLKAVRAEKMAVEFVGLCFDGDLEGVQAALRKGGLL